MLLIAALLVSDYVLASDEPPLQVSEPSFSFEIFDPVEPVIHTFDLQNSGSETIQVERIAVTEPLQVVKVLSKIAPGDSGQLIVSLGTPRQLGEYEGAIEISFKNKDLIPMRLAFTGKITPVIEVRPLPAFFVATTRGKTNGASLEVVNQDSEPLKIKEIRSPSSRYEMKLATLEEGRRYRLDLVMRADAKPGRQTEDITLITSSKKQPQLAIQANTLVHERVYAFPESIDLGSIKQSELKSNPGLTNLLSQPLIIYQEGGKNFQISAVTDLDVLKVEAACAKSSDRCEIQIQVAVNKLVPGPVNGFIRIKTNDPEFPELKVPVKGSIE